MPVAPEDAAQWRDPLAWHFASFCRGGQWTPDDLWRDVETMQRQLWVAYDGEVKAAVLTSVADDLPQTLVVTHAAGRDRASWLHLWADLEGFARSIGCKRIEAVARRGWERDLKGLGLRATHTVMEKAL